MRIRIALATACAVASTTSFIVALAPAAGAAARTDRAHTPGVGERLTVTTPAWPSAQAVRTAVSTRSRTAPAIAVTATRTRRSATADLAPAAPPLPAGPLVPWQLAPIPPPPPTDATSIDTADWQCIRVHESGDRYNDPDAPSGAYGIIEETWEAYGYEGWPYQAPAAVQDALALRLYNEYGWNPWGSRWACGL